MEQVQGVVGVADVPLLGQVTVGVIGIPVFPVTDQLVGGVVAILGLDAAHGLGEHVAHRVIGVGLCYAVRAFKAGELTQGIINIAAFQSRSVLGAALFRHAARQVIGVFQGQVVGAGGGLADEVAHLIVSIAGVFLGAVGGDAAAHGVIAVLGGRPIYAFDGDKAVHAVIGILDRLAVGVGHGEAVAVAVVSVADGIAIGLGDGEQAAPVVILVLGQNLSFLFQSCHFLKSFSSGNSGSNSGLFTRI